jgi:hypothetical protein
VAQKLAGYFSDSLGNSVINLVYLSTTQKSVTDNGTRTVIAAEVVLATRAESAVSSPMLTFNPTNGSNSHVLGVRRA